MGELIRVDKEKCIQCGNCAAVCPSEVVQLEDGGYPTDVHDMCNACGHCVAVCPVAALDNTRAPLAGMLPVVAAERIGKTQATQFIRARRSTRCYQNKKVEREKLEELLELVRHAPSGNNAQGVGWLVIQNEAKLDKIAHACVDFIEAQGEEDSRVGRGMEQLAALLRMRGERPGVLRSAPCLLVALCRRQPNPAKRKNAIIAQATAELYAPMLGLASCWAGFLEIALDAGAPAVLDAMELPEERSAVGALLLGYPEYEFYRMPERRPLEAYWAN